VPVRLAQVASELIAGHLDKLQSREWRPYPKGRESLRKIYVQSHIRTRQWFKDGEIFVWGEDESSPSYAAPKTKRKVASMKG